MEYLTLWTENYLRSRDAIFKKIENMEAKDRSIYIKNKDGSSKKVLIEYVPDFEKIKIPEGEFLLVVLNNKENIENLTKSWKKLVEKTNLIIMFVNPFSMMETKWMIHPHTHQKITGGENLKKGLNSLASNVQYISLKEFEKESNLHA